MAGEIRPVGRGGTRLREAARLGFRKAIVSHQQKGFPERDTYLSGSEHRDALQEVMP